MNLKLCILLFVPLFLTISQSFAEPARTSKSLTYLNNIKAPTAPITYFDSDSKILFYVESDGRHVTAIDQKGKILWHRNPFEEAQLEAYRTPRPVIVWIGKPKLWGLSIEFDSSQFGSLNPTTGEFKFRGQD